MTALGDFQALKRFARRPAEQERCELCGTAIAPAHEHLLELVSRQLACACQACAILFSGQTGQRYKRVPARSQLLRGFHITDVQWESLLVPINMVFFYRKSSSDSVSAAYPSPAGAVESQLPLETWQEIAAENPLIDAMEPDVEALLVNRMGEQRGFPEHQYFVVPIDQCFQLVGLVRTHWRGLSGGDEMWRRLQSFFADLTARAQVSGSVHA